MAKMFWSYNAYALLVTALLAYSLPSVAGAAEAAPQRRPDAAFPRGSARSPEVLPDTAGAHLRDVWTAARRKYRDAVLISISGKTDLGGVVTCDPEDPFQDGWRYTFYSPKKDVHIMMASCRGRIAGPLRQFLARSSKGPKRSISGKFLDSDTVIKTMRRGGAKFDEVQATSGKRPFVLLLHRLPDERFKTHPAVWKVRLGRKVFLVDAKKREMLNPESYGIMLTQAPSSSTVITDGMGTRPEKKDVYTAKADLERVLQYAREQYPGSRLMAIEGFVDAWGGSPCTGPGDGWAYYFYYPKTRDYEAVFACNGYIGPGPLRYIPVDLTAHQPVSGRFVDSSRAVDGVLMKYGYAMNEGLGRRFTRTGTLLLRHYRVTPFDRAAMWKIKLVWELTLGSTRFRMDAVSGRVIDVRE